MPYQAKKSGPAPLNGVLKVFKVANPDQQDLIEVYLMTGAPKNELRSLTWDDVDMRLSMTDR